MADKGVAVIKADKPSTAKGKGKGFIVNSTDTWCVKHWTAPEHALGVGKRCAGNAPRASRPPDGDSGPSPTANPRPACTARAGWWPRSDRKSTRLNSSH